MRSTLAKVVCSESSSPYDRAGETTAHTDTYHGHFVTLVPNELVVEVMKFETSDVKMRGEMMVTFTLTDAGGGTDVLAVYDNLPPGVSPATNETGWRVALDKLARFVEAGQKKFRGTWG